METKVVAAGAAGAGIGVAQTLLLREYVDRKYPTTNIAALKGFGTPSALAGLIGGAAGIAAGVVGISKRPDMRQRLPDIVIEPATDYGVAALVGGIISGIKPAVTEADCVAKGGYWYNGACHKTPAATVSMDNMPQVQAAMRPYTAPAYTQQPVIDMGVVRQLSAEVQRLAQENAQLRTMQPLPGQVYDKQVRYGFMEPAKGPIAPTQLAIPTPGQPTTRGTEFGFMQTRGPIAPSHLQYAPGQPVPAAREFGFMDASPMTPTVKVQQMQGRYDFLG